jgi:hypothetical protein
LRHDGRKIPTRRIAADRLRMGDRLVIFPDRAFPPPLPVGR